MPLRKPFFTILLFAMLELSVSVKASGGTAVLDASLAPEEEATLLFMREEEKLARDVYLTMHQIYQSYDGSAIFENIAESEQRHMDAIKELLDKYRLDDPAQEAIGEFTDPGLQSLYDELIARGRESFLEALFVGALIEEKDMVDIQLAIDESTHDDIIRVYEQLLDGSKNHLRAFIRQIELLGVDYQAILN
ncbi:MAG: DUF2202 domain-containing protein [Gammaproteobacteria bacterium]